jgi:hypothetical protein
MDIVGNLLELVKYTLPAVVVLAASYLIVKKFLVSQIQRQQIALFKDSQDITLRLRLHAYERMVLFVERIGTRQLVNRLYNPSMTVRDLQVAMVMTIRTEFEHNLSQQIYVSRNVWETVKGVKEQEINMVNQLSKTLDGELPAKELHTRIMNIVLQTDEELPTDVALNVINDEVRRVMAFDTIS